MLVLEETLTQPSASHMADQPIPKLEEIAERIRLVMAKRQLKPLDIVHRSNGVIKKSTLKSWRTENDAERSEPGVIRLALLAQVMEVSLDFLLYGDEREVILVDAVDVVRKLATEKDPDRRRTMLATELVRFIPFIFPVSMKIRNGLKHKSVVVDAMKAAAYTEEVAQAIGSELKDLQKLWDQMVSTWEAALRRIL